MLDKDNILRWICPTCVNYDMCRGAGCGEIEKAYELIASEDLKFYREYSGRV